MKKNNAKLKQLVKENYKLRQLVKRHYSSMRLSDGAYWEMYDLWDESECLRKEQLNEIGTQQHIIEGLADAAKEIHREMKFAEAEKRCYFELWNKCYNENWLYQSAGFFKRLKYLFTGKI